MMLSMHRIKPGELSIDLYRAFVAARDQREYGDYEVASIIGWSSRSGPSPTPGRSSTRSRRCSVRRVT